MISLRKLASLSDGTRHRKTVVLLRDFEKKTVSGESIDQLYLRGLMEMISRDDFWPDPVLEKSRFFFSGNSGNNDTLRSLNFLRHEMLDALGRDWADWDIETASDNDALPVHAEGLFPVRVYLDGLRSPFNAGSIMRTSLAFGVEKMWFSPEGTSPDHRRARRSAMGAADRISREIKSLEKLPVSQTGTVFALEIGGVDIGDFRFPSSGTVIIGSEELGVSPSALKRAESDGGVVSIPLPGPKASLNVGVAFGILLRQWVASLS